MNRLRLTLGLAFAFLFAANSNAQEETSTFSLGPSLGFGQTWLTGVDNVDIGFQPAISAGLTAMYSTRTRWGFGADLLYSMEGGQFESSTLDSDVKLHYLRLPLKAAYFFRDIEDDFRPKITLGPSVAYLLKGEVENRPSGGSSTTTDMTDTYTNWDIGAQASVGFNLRVAENAWFNADVTYYRGFIDIMGDYNNNSNLGLKVAIAFGL